MTTRWFGEPWPADELRAPICEDDALRVPVPLGYRCLPCDKAFEADDQGIVMTYVGPALEGVSFENDEGPAIGEHLECFLLSILGQAES